MTKFLRWIGVALLYVALLSVGVVLCWFFFPPKDGDYKDFRDAAAVYFGGLTIVSTAGVSLYTANRSTEAAQKLATIQADLQLQINAVQQINQERLEALKATKYSREIDAYYELLTAAKQYYFALSKMQNGTWRIDYMPALQEGMSKVYAKVAYLADESEATLWEKTWQSATFLAESGAAKPPKEQPKFWEDNLKEFAGLISQFQGVVRSRFPRP